LLLLHISRFSLASLANDGNDDEEATVFEADISDGHYQGHSHTRKKYSKKIPATCISKQIIV
jgi:hypothetical protein